MTRKGYGTIPRDGTRLYDLAHRWAYNRFKGDPGELCVLHRCDTPACVNPDHLFLGTKADNIHDMHSKKRHRTRARGRVLNEGQVREIRRRCANGENKTLIAKAFGVERNQIYGIASGRMWASIPFD